MSEIMLMKTPSGALVAADSQAADYIAKLKLGAGVRAKVTRVNNPAFHRKMMALFNLAFDAWDPAQKEYKGIKVQKEFDRFRKDVTILAGFYETSLDFHGNVRLQAKSLNFASMDQGERESVYSAVINVVLSRILTNYTRDDLDRVIDQVLGFA